MLRASVAAFVLAVLSAPAAALAAPPLMPLEAPEYSPLPPPPPPPTDRAGRPAPRVVPQTKPPVSPPAPATPAPASVPASPPATTTTSSATMPADGSAPRETPPARRSHLDDERFSVSPLLGFGTNNLELGVGVRAGAAAFAPHLWVGGTFLFHNGTSRSGTTAPGGVPYSAGSSVIYFGPEVGYDLELGPVLLRPYGGIGPALFRVSSSVGNVSTSDTATRLLLWTGGTVLYGIPGSRFFVGGDARAITVPAGPAFALYVLGGMTF